MAKERDNRTPIVFVNGSAAVEGDTRVLINTVATLDQARYRPIALTPPGGAANELRRLPGVEVHEGPLGPAQRWFPGKLGEAVAFLSATWFVLSRVRASKARIIYTYDRTRAAESAFVAAKLLRRKFVFHAHYPLFLADRRVRRFVGFHADRIVIGSAFAAGFYLEAGAPAARTRVVLNGVDVPAPTANPTDLRAQMGVSADAPVVGMVGRLSPFKGQEEVIRAAALLRERFPGLRLLISGRDTDESRWTHGPEATSYRAILERVRAELGMESCVDLLGFAEAADVYAASDVVVAPSHAEPFGLIVIEGMLAGKPVVSTNAGGVPEIITHGETGVLVTPKDPQSLADGIASLLADDGLRAKIAAAGEAHARVAFSRERYAREFAAAIADL